MMRRIVYIVLTIFIIVGAAVPAFGGYKSSLRRATKDEGIYDLYTGNARILMKATLFTDEFRRAFAEKHADIHYMNPDERAAWIAEQEGMQHGGWVVFISMYTPKQYREFSLRHDTFWTTYLTNEAGESVYPVTIEQLKKRPYWKVMFPYIGKWSAIYRVTFPKIELGSTAMLTMQSVVGRKTVTWKIAERR